MSQIDLIYIFVEFIISVSIIIFTIVVLWKKSRLIKWNQAAEAKKVWMKKHDKKINKVCYAILLLMSLIALINIAIPFICDIPYIIEGKYLTITGKAKRQDHGGRNSKQKREADIIKDNGDSVRIRFFSYYVNEGEEVTVVYLPHLKYGTRIK